MAFYIDSKGIVREVDPNKYAAGTKERAAIDMLLKTNEYIPPVGQTQAEIDAANAKLEAEEAALKTRLQPLIDVELAKQKAAREKLLADRAAAKIKKAADAAAAKKASDAAFAAKQARLVVEREERAAAILKNKEELAALQIKMAQDKIDRAAQAARQLETQKAIDESIARAAESKQYMTDLKAEQQLQLTKSIPVKKEPLTVFEYAEKTQPGGALRFAGDEATVLAKAARDSDFLKTGNPILDEITGNLKYGSTHLIETGKEYVGNVLAIPAYAATGSEEVAAGVKEAGRIGTSIVTLVSPTTAVAATTATLGTSKSNEEFVENLAFDVALAGAGQIVSGTRGIVKPIVKGTGKIEKAADVGLTVAENIMPLYFTAEAIGAGSTAVQAAASGDVDLARDIDRQLAISLATSKPGEFIAGKIIASPKVVVQTGKEVLSGSIFADTGAAVARIKDAPAYSIADIGIQKESFRELATPEQTVSLQAGEKPSLPITRGLDTLITKGYEGKPQTFIKEQFPNIIKAEDPVVFRTSTYDLPVDTTIPTYRYEERGVYTGPDVSTIGLPQIGTKDSSTSYEFSVFPKPKEEGKILIIKPESIETLPTTKSYSDITPTEYVQLRKDTGIDLQALGDTKYDSDIGPIGTNILKQEVKKVTDSSGRPFRMQDIQKSLTGEEWFVDVKPELSKGFVEPTLKPGTVSPSIPFTLGKGGEAEFIAYPVKDSYFREVKAKKPSIQTDILKRPELYFSESGAKIPAKFYELISKDTLKDLSPKEQTKIINLKDDIAKAQKAIDSGKTSVGKNIEYVPLISTRTSIKPISYTAPTPVSTPPQKVVSYVPDMESIVVEPVTYTEPKVTYTAPIKSEPIFTSYVEPIKSEPIVTSYIKPIKSEPIFTSYVDPIVTSYTKPSKSKPIVTYTNSIFSEPISTTKTTKPVVTMPESIFSPTKTSSPKGTSTDFFRDDSRTDTRKTDSKKDDTRRPDLTRITDVSRFEEFSRPVPKPRLKDYFKRPIGVKQQLYDVLVRKGKDPETGKKRKISEVLVAKGLPYPNAVNRGLRTVDKYSQRTAIIRKTNKKSKKQFFNEPLDKNLMGQFRQLSTKSKIKTKKGDIIFVEKSKHAISSYEEKQGIPYKAAKLAKAKLGKFGEMRI